MKVLSNEYLAGLFDGEGCVSISKYHPVYSTVIYQYCLRIFLVNTNKEVIDLLFAQFGGTVSKYEHKGNHKPTWQWSLSTRQAYWFLKDIFPFLVIKKKQAEVAIKFAEYKREHRVTKKRLGTFDSVILEYEKQSLLMHQLNKRGVI